MSSLEGKSLVDKPLSEIKQIDKQTIERLKEFGIQTIDDLISTNTNLIKTIVNVPGEAKNNRPSQKKKDNFSNIRKILMEMGFIFTEDRIKYSKLGIDEKTALKPIIELPIVWNVSEALINNGIYFLGDLLLLCLEEITKLKKMPKKSADTIQTYLSGCNLSLRDKIAKPLDGNDVSASIGKMIPLKPHIEAAIKSHSLEILNVLNKEEIELLKSCGINTIGDLLTATPIRIRRVLDIDPPPINKKNQTYHNLKKSLMEWGMLFDNESKDLMKLGVDINIALMPINIIPIPRRVRNALEKKKVSYLGALLTLPKEELLGMPNVGRISVEEMLTTLQTYNWQLTEELNEETNYEGCLKEGMDPSPIDLALEAAFKGKPIDVLLGLDGIRWIKKETISALKEHGINTIQDLLREKAENLKRIVRLPKYDAPLSYIEIRQKIMENGLLFDEDRETYESLGISLAIALEPIAKTSLLITARNALIRKAQIYFLGDLLTKNSEEISGIDTMGPGSYQSILDYLKARGLHLKNMACPSLEDVLTQRIQHNINLIIAAYSKAERLPELDEMIQVFLEQAMSALQKTSATVTPSSLGDDGKQSGAQMSLKSARIKP